jgi:hypothetical protein
LLQHNFLKKKSAFDLAKRKKKKNGYVVGWEEKGRKRKGRWVREGIVR